MRATSNDAGTRFVTDAARYRSIDCLQALAVAASAVTPALL